MVLSDASMAKMGGFSIARCISEPSKIAFRFEGFKERRMADWSGLEVAELRLAPRGFHGIECPPVFHVPVESVSPAGLPNLFHPF
jgi:hypothetical protein